MNSTVKEPHLDPPDDDSEQMCPLCGCVVDECESPEEYDAQISATGRFADAYLVVREEGHRGKWVSREEWEEMKSDDIMSNWFEEDTL